MTWHPTIQRSHRRPVLGLLMILALGALLAACAPAAQPIDAPAQAPAATGAPTEAPAATAAPTQAPAHSDAPTEAPAATVAPAQPPAPTEAPTEAAAATEAPVQAAAASFAKDVQPILERSCLKCHGGSDGVKGGLSVKSYADLMKGGKDGQVVAPGDAANSMLVQLIVDGEMPKRASRLPQNEIDIIAAWVNAGARND